LRWLLPFGLEKADKEKARTLLRNAILRTADGLSINVVFFAQPANEVVSEVAPVHGGIANHEVVRDPSHVLDQHHFWANGVYELKVSFHELVAWIAGAASASARKALARRPSGQKIDFASQSNQHARMGLHQRFNRPRPLLKPIGPFELGAMAAVY
jgi:hypothetical protein